MAERIRTSLPEQVKSRALDPEIQSVKDPPVTRFLSTGCSLLNCALSDRVDGGWPSGRISNLIGDSDTAKTVLSLHALAESCRTPSFDDYKIIYADIESALTETTKSMFGNKLRERGIFLSTDNEDKKKRPPETIEELHYQWLDLFKEGDPFIYIVDSLDFLPSIADLEKSEEQKIAWEKGKDTSGTYQMNKQKRFKQMMRELKGKISQTDSIIIIVSQTIDNIGSMFDPKTVTGGNALEFASRIRLWLSKLEADKVGNRVIGRKIKVKISKNHITGHLREIPIWVYNGFGVDDTKTSIDFLVAEGAWEKKGGWILPNGIVEEKFTMKQLIDFIESKKLNSNLDALVQKTWSDIEDGLKLNRERRYE